MGSILGAAQAAALVAHLDAGGGDYRCTIPAATYRMLVENDQAKRSAMPHT